MLLLQKFNFVKNKQLKTTKQKKCDKNRLKYLYNFNRSFFIRRLNHEISRH